MILAFSKERNNKPTLVAEKVINCLHYDLKYGAVLNDYLNHEVYGYEFSHTLIAAIQKTKPQRHAIIKDDKNEWQTGCEIDFSLELQSTTVQFAPVVKCVSTQTIRFSYNDKDCEQQCCEPAIYIDDKPIDFETLKQLAKNDGFADVVDFLTYFDSNYTGKIIHWTDLKY